MHAKLAENQRIEDLALEEVAELLLEEADAEEKILLVGDHARPILRLGENYELDITQQSATEPLEGPWDRIVLWLEESQLGTPEEWTVKAHEALHPGGSLGLALWSSELPVFEAAGWKGEDTAEAWVRGLSKAGYRHMEAYEVDAAFLFEDENQAKAYLADAFGETDATPSEDIVQVVNLIMAKRPNASS